MGKQPEKVIVSYLIVRYNALEEVRSCLNSILGQEGPGGREVILVDNASPEGGQRRLAAEFPEVRFFNNKVNVGFARAVNQAAQKAEGDYLFLFNPDSFFIAGNPAERVLVDWLAEHPRAAAAGPMLINSDGTLQTSAYAFPTVLQTAAHLSGIKRLLPLGLVRGRAPGWLASRFGQLDSHQRAKVVDYCTGAALMVRREAWSEVGGLDERFFLYYEEKDLCLKLKKTGYQVHFVPQARIGHHIGASSETVPEIARLARYQSMLDYFAKNKPGQLPVIKLMLTSAATAKHLLTALGGAREEARTWRKVARLKENG